MTCIISLLTDNYVMQVSDRRFTARDRAFSRKLMVVDDDANKALILDNRFSVAFTGLARIGKQTSEEYLAELWAKQPFGPNGDAALRMQSCASLLTERFNRIGWSSALKRLAYTGVGWIAQERGKMAPAYFAITNFHGSEGWQLRAQPEFQVLHQFKAERQIMYLAHSGVGIPSSNWSRFSRDTRKLLERSRPAEVIAVRMLDMLLTVAANRDDVGSSAMITCIPRVAPELNKTFQFAMDWPNGINNTVCYYSPKENSYVQVSPIFASEGSIFKASASSI